MEFFLADKIFNRFDPVEKDQPSEVVVLVLKDTGDEVFKFLVDGLAFAGGVADGDFSGAGNKTADTGDAQAAFPVFDSVFRLRKNFGVDDQGRLHFGRIRVTRVGMGGNDE